MAILNYNIPNLINGVSNQPIAYRLPNQADVCDNLWPSVPAGLTRRPGMSLVKRLDNRPENPPQEPPFTQGERFGKDSFYHLIDRGPTEKYLLVIFDELHGGENSGWVVINLITGEEVTVAGSPTTDSQLGHTLFPHHYFRNGGDLDPAYDIPPRERLRAVTVGDSTYIVNTLVPVRWQGTFPGSFTDYYPLEPDPDLSPDLNQFFYHWVKLAPALGEIKLFLDNTNGSNAVITLNIATKAWSYNASDGYSSSGTFSYLEQNTTAIARGFAEVLNASNGWYSGGSNGAIFVAFSSGLTIKATNVTDSIGDQSVETLYGSVDSLADLPSRAPKNLKVLVRGNANSDEDDYYLKFEHKVDAPGVDISHGSWVETIGPLLPYAIAPQTMPHVLTFNSYDNFTMGQMTLVDRDAGDDLSAPPPAFINNKINNIFFWQDRLCFLTGESVVMSEVGHFDNYFRTTVLALPDSDPISVAINAPKSGELLNAIPYNSRVILFSREIQFALYGNPVVTPGTIAAHPVSAIPTDGTYTPVQNGRFLYFGHGLADNFRLAEFFVETDGETYDFTDVSAHAFQYVPQAIQDISSSSALDLICMVPQDNTGELYFYKSYWQGNQKVQSAWFRIFLGPNLSVSSAVFVRNVLYVVAEDTEGVLGDSTNIRGANLFALEFTDDDTLGNLTFAPYLDRRIASDDTGLSMSYDAGSDVTRLRHDAWTDWTYVTHGEGPGDGGWYPLFSSLTVALEDGTSLTGSAVLVSSSGGHDEYYFEIPGDITGETFWAGVTFESVYTLPYLILKGGANGVPANYLKSAQVLSSELHYEDSLDFDLEVSKGDYGVHTASAGIPEGTELEDGVLKTTVGTLAKDTVISAKANGVGPMKLTSAGYAVRIYGYQSPNE